MLLFICNVIKYYKVFNCNIYMKLIVNVVLWWCVKKYLLENYISKKWLKNIYNIFKL